MNHRIQQLAEEIVGLTRLSVQALQDGHGLLFSVQNRFRALDDADRHTLKELIPCWTNNELQIFALALLGGDANGDIPADDFFTGIFLGLRKMRSLRECWMIWISFLNRENCLKNCSMPFHAK